MNGRRMDIYMGDRMMMGDDDERDDEAKKNRRKKKLPASIESMNTEFKPTQHGC